MDAINLFSAKHGVTAVWQHDVHPEMQRKQYGDEWWIADVAARGMAILTQDRAILIDPAERAAAREAGAKLIALGSAEYSTWDKLRCLTRHWDHIEDILARDGAHAIVVMLSRSDFIAL